MNIVDAACSVCGAPTTYTGALPILCRKCFEEKVIKPAEYLVKEWDKVPTKDTV